MKEIFERKSSRMYTDQPVSDELVEKIMRAAMAAPSAGNQQPWVFYVTRDPEKLQAIADSSPYSKPAGKCNVIIVPCTKLDELKHAGMADQDMGACCQNILLEAEHLGLGTVWLGTKPEKERMDQVASIMGIPASHEPYATICLGYSDDPREPSGASRYDEERVHWV